MRKKCRRSGAFSIRKRGIWTVSGVKKNGLYEQAGQKKACPFRFRYVFRSFATFEGTGSLVVTGAPTLVERTEVQG